MHQNQQPQPDHAHAFQPMGETHEAPQDHTLTGFKAYLGYTTKRHAFSGVPVPDAPEDPQYRPPPQPVEAKLHCESKVIQRCFDDNNDDNKR